MNSASRLRSMLLRKAHNFRAYSSVLGVPQTVLMYSAQLLRLSTLNLKVRGIAHAVECRPTNSDRHALSQIFIEHDSDIPMAHSPKFIIDGGSNVGYASVLFANRYPEARILAIEPDLTNYQIAQRNCNNYPNIQVIRAGIWTSNAPLIIDNPDAESWAFHVRESSGQVPHSVPGYTISHLLTKYDIDVIDLLKLDIEGAEEYIFTSPDLEWLRQVRALVVETHNDTAYEALVDAMKKFAFTQSQRGEKHVFVNSLLS